MRTVSRSGCWSLRSSSSSVRLPPKMAVLPRACSCSAKARPIPLVEPGMKTVLPAIFIVVTFVVVGQR